MLGGGFRPEPLAAEMDEDQACRLTLGALVLSMRRRTAPSHAWSRLHGFVSPELAGNFAVEIAAVAV